MPHARVERIVSEAGTATAVRWRHGARCHESRADLVVLAAGGLATPGILEASGISTKRTLFVDPVLCVAARWERANLDRQLPMPFVSERDGYILSPYFDWLSFYFNRAWRMASSDIMSLMIKMADAGLGSFDGRSLDKQLTDADWETIARAIDECYLVFEDLGVRREDTFLGTLNAGHPGGCMPLTRAEAKSLHHEVLPTTSMWPMPPCCRALWAIRRSSPSWRSPSASRAWRQARKACDHSRNRRGTFLRMRLWVRLVEGHIR